MQPFEALMRPQAQNGKKQTMQRSQTKGFKGYNCISFNSSSAGVVVDQESTWDSRTPRAGTPAAETEIKTCNQLKTSFPFSLFIF